LSDKLVGGAHYARDGRVDPRRLLKALHIAAYRSGAEFRSGAYVRRIVCDADVARGIALDDGSEISARQVLVAAGSWTTLLEGTGLAPGRVLPARGQIIELELSRPLLRSVVFGPGAYLVPRDDGRLLVGSTLEFVGYQRDVTAGAVKNLLNAALTLVPALEHGSLKDTWSNFRPYTPNELPLIGRSPIKNLLLATGHFRNGILLAPITAEIIAALVLGQRPAIDLAPFSPARNDG
jgi:glycine oxidase